MRRVVVEGISKMWDATSGLRPVDAIASAGEMIVVRGRSGSGKSTLLAIVAGICTPDVGTVTVNGAPPTGDEPWSDIALVPQTLCLIPELSLIENVLDALGPESADHVGEILDRLGLGALTHRPIDHLSTGQQQRTAVARATAASPLVLLADEPTAFQDSGHAAAVIAGLREAARLGSAVIIASHDAEVIAAADRVIDLEV